MMRKKSDQTESALGVEPFRKRRPAKQPREKFSVLSTHQRTDGAVVFKSW